MMSKNLRCGKPFLIRAQYNHHLMNTHHLKGDELKKYWSSAKDEIGPRRPGQVKRKIDEVKDVDDME
jgi:hypothetical protein